jgi:hypothetical protein
LFHAGEVLPKRGRDVQRSDNRNYGWRTNVFWPARA